MLNVALLNIKAAVLPVPTREAFGGKYQANTVYYCDINAKSV
jgi:hypothetical protein